VSDNVVRLGLAQTPVAPIDAKTVAYLEDMLARAKSGEIQGVALVTIESNGAGSVLSVGTGWEGEGFFQNVHAAVGGAAFLQKRLLGLLE